MNLYNIIISSVITSFILILVEGLIFFTLLSTIFNDIFQSVFNLLSSQINNFINQNYYTYLPIINLLSGRDISKETFNFQSSIIKIFLVGTMSEKIIEEQQFININKIICYAIYSAILFGFMILIYVIIYINKNIYSNVSNISSLIYNVGISLLLFIIFIVIVTFVVFINIANNIDINPLEIKAIKLIQNLFT